MKINLYVDDLRRCPENFLLARTIDEAIEILQTQTVSVLSLDHHLGATSSTGTDIVRYMIAVSVFPNKIYLHTSSASGRQEMYDLLMAHKPTYVQVHPYAMDA